MFEGKTFLEILQLGGSTMYVLLLCSFISIAIFLERLAYYWKQSRIDRNDFIARLREAILENDPGKAKTIAEATETPYARVIGAGLEEYGHSDKIIAGAMDRKAVEEVRNLERFTGIVGTIGNIGVYIGLMGTVLGIIRAFHDIAMTGSGGMSTVIEGVAEALVCTGTGLVVAIPAVIFFNYLSRRIELFADDMQSCASELMCLLERR
ncbi:MAG: MotA/TolQ/ExbB proton channel family protein [Bacillota bacterium]|jgi:biopolymer transport protein ExbB/TolQ|nr:MotA/TolQ/ExbB proton channel family protein [Bacillota bacterium]